MTANRYVVVSVDTSDKTIYGGPMLWDGQGVFDPGPGRKLIPDTDARAQGYTFPAPPAAEVNADALRDRAAAALDANAAFLANNSPTNAQVLGQVRLLTRECNAVIRLLLGMLNSTDGT